MSFTGVITSSDVNLNDDLCDVYSKHVIKRHRDQTTIIHIVNVVRAKGRVDDEANKHLLLSTSAAKALQICRVSFIYHVRIEIFFLCCELSRIVGQMRISIHLRRRKLMLRNLPSNTMRYSTIICSRVKYFYIKVDVVNVTLYKRHLLTGQ